MNVAASQTFFNDTLAFELVYDSSTTPKAKPI